MRREEEEVKMFSGEMQLENKTVLLETISWQRQRKIKWAFNVKGISLYKAEGKISVTKPFESKSIGVMDLCFLLYEAQYMWIVFGLRTGDKNTMTLPLSRFKICLCEGQSLIRMPHLSQKLSLLTHKQKLQKASVLLDLGLCNLLLPIRITGGPTQWRRVKELDPGIQLTG